MKYIRPVLRSKLFRFFFIIYLAFFVFDKAFSIDVVFADDTVISGYTFGQLQNLNISNTKHLRFYSDEFHVFSDYPVNENNFRWYGQPGANPINGLSLTGDLSTYTELFSIRLNDSSYYRNMFRNWFLLAPSQPLPTDEQENNYPVTGETGPVFDINDLDFNLAATFFAGGFAIFLLPWLNAYGFSALLSFIKRA
jgi:hypothetical protein